MENTNTTDLIIHKLLERVRVVTLGGIAVISHGLSRNTHDVDVWAEPLESPGHWATRLEGILFPSHSVFPIVIGTWEPVAQGELESVIARDGVVRVAGLDRPLDIFRNPNELDIDEFDDVWDRATPLADGTRLPDVIDILVTKQDTGRDKDLQDIVFLEAKAEREYLKILPAADAAQAVRMLERFLTPRVVETAMDHPAEAVRSLAVRYLREMADDGNPFARDILIKRNLS